MSNVKQPKLVSLFPYQIKDRELFYYRNHPKNLNPKSEAFQKYWKDFRQKCIEGRWINDNGTWVYMMPKLFMYINYLKISMDKDRDFAPPRLRDNEWIFASYTLCFDGFSGFELDEEFTCHDFIRRMEVFNDPKTDEKEKQKVELNELEQERIPSSCLKSDGTYKKYIDPWHYLTRHYLLENPAKQPLGNALYENTRYNGCVLSGRGVSKSYWYFLADFLHEWSMNGIRSVKDIKRINDKLLFAMGSGDGDPLNRSLKNISTFYDRMPGQYSYNDPKKQKYMGPFYKRVQGSWHSGDEIKHAVKRKRGGRPYIDSSILQMPVITADKTKIAAGDRFRRIYVEEFGFLKSALSVHAANKDSLKAEGIKVGSAVYLGTGGELESIKEPKKIFDNPETYDIFGIPNYWENPNKKIALFIPVHYVDGSYKDKNGNTKLEICHKDLLRQREADRMIMDSLSYDKSVSFNPMEPKEILRANSGSILPKREAQDQLDKLDTFDIFKKKAQIGSLKYDHTQENGVKWEKDMDNVLRPILDFEQDDIVDFGKDGAWIIYEQPPSQIPANLYWVIYDPAKKSGDGSSYHSILVYKGFYFGGSEKTLYDTIVAELICRKETLDKNYHEVIKGAKYFNAKIFPEINVAGFVEWCKTNKYWHMLEGDAFQVEEEISKNAIRSYYKVGVDMNSERKKNHALEKLRDWLIEVKEHDPITGVPMITTLDWIFSKRILNEVVAYEDGGNYDHISSLLCLMILLGKLHGEKVKLKDEYEEVETPENRRMRLMIENQNAAKPRQRARAVIY